MSPTTVPWKHHLAWGLGLGGAVALSTQILTWIGLGLSHLTWISTYVLAVMFAYLGARSFRSRLGARPGFLQTALMIAVMVLVSRFIYQTYMYVYITYVDPGWVDRVAEVWSAQLAEAGSSAEKIQQNIASFRRQWKTGYVFTLGVIGFGIPQFVLGLLTAVIGVVQPWKRRSGG